MKLAIVILNYNTADLTIACLRSVAEDAVGIETTIIVVDNGSTDDSPRRIGEAISQISSARLVALPKNVGFAAGNNRGIELLGQADYVLLLNSDTVVHRGCFKTCIAAMESDAGIGVLGCRLETGDGTPQTAARKFPTPFRLIATDVGVGGDLEDLSWDRRTCKRDVDWLGGAFLFIRAEVLKTCGPLDEDFFFYGEDVEFCHRVWKHGFRCHYDSAAVVTHFGGGSNSVNQYQLRQTARYLIQRKCYGRVAETCVRWADAIAGKIRSIFK